MAVVAKGADSEASNLPAPNPPVGKDAIEGNAMLAPIPRKNARLVDPDCAMGRFLFGRSISSTIYSRQLAFGLACVGKRLIV